MRENRTYGLMRGREGEFESFISCFLFLLYRSNKAFRSTHFTLHFYYRCRSVAESGVELFAHATKRISRVMPLQERRVERSRNICPCDNENSRMNF